MHLHMYAYCGVWCMYVCMCVLQSFDTRGTLQLVSGHSHLGVFASELLKEVRPYT